MSCAIIKKSNVKSIKLQKGGKKCQVAKKKWRLLARNLLDNLAGKTIIFVKSIIFSKKFLSRHRNSEKHFLRNRKLPFSTLILFLINLIKGSCQDELDHFFKATENQDVPVRRVTKSAFTKPRKKLKHSAFIELIHKLGAFFYNHFSPRNWQGFRLPAIDGSTAKVPNTEQIAKHFGVWNTASGKKCPLARISQMFDVLNRITIDARISPKEKGERILAGMHLDFLKSNDLLLLDRGYPAFWLFDLILSAGANFCARVSATQWKTIETFYNSGKTDKIVWLTPTGSAIKTYKELGMSPKPIKVRLIRIDGDSFEEPWILVTSLLDRVAFPVEIFAELYHRRWPVEEDYKTMKCRLEIENFSGKSVEAVYQDFYAKVFSCNLTAVLAHPTRDIIEENSKEKKHPYQLNFTQALSKMKDTIVLLFQRTNISEIISEILSIFIKTIEPVRPGRSYPRNHKVNRRGFYMAYKPIR